MHTSVVSLALRPLREGREGSDTLGSEGALMPDEAAAAAPTPSTTAALSLTQQASVFQVMWSLSAKQDVASCTN